MIEKRHRKEVQLVTSVAHRLQKLADKRKWSLKKYMEYVLEKDSIKADIIQTNNTKTK